MAQRAPETTVNIPTLIRREATFLPETVDDANRTVELTWTTGARVLRGFWDRYWEELSLDPKHVRMKRLNNGAPLLSDHRGSIMSVVGVVEEASLDAKRGRAKVRFAKAEDDPEADKIYRKVKDGILQNISVGYSTYKMEKVEDGADKIPVYRAVDWEPYELSIVAMGADDGAGFRSQTPNSTTPCVFVTPGAVSTVRKAKAMADEDDETTPTTATQESPAVAATRAARQASADERRRLVEAEQEAAKAAIAAERARAAAIRDIGKRSKLGTEWADRLIATNVTVEQAREAAFNEIADPGDEIDSNTGLRVSAGDDARDKFIRGASAWMFERTGTRKMLEQAKKKDPETFSLVSFDAGEFRGYSPLELARLSLERQGVRTRGMDKMQLLGLAFTHRSGSYQTAGDFANMLENVLGKVLLGAYATQENTWERWCGVDQVPDFRTSNRHRTGSVDSLATIAEHGEYQNGVIPDSAKYGIATERKGRIFSLSREVLVNDDMGALTNLAMEFGRASGRTIENGAFAQLALNSGLGPTMSDSQPFFHANRANVNATGSALSVAGIDADRVVMRAQKDPNSKDYLDLSPSILLVPDALKGTAQVINDAQYDPDTANKLQRPNMVRGLFNDVIGSPRLSASSTRRYLFANPAIAPAFVVAFLEGYGRGPILESRDGWRIDGVEWKVTLYAKVQPGDPKGAVTNAGQ